MLGRNLQLMGNMRDATTMSQLQSGQIVDAYMKQKAAEEGTPLALAMYKQMNSEWLKKKAELMHSLALNQALLSPSGNHEQDFQNRMQYLRMNGMGDMAKNAEEKHLPNYGQSSINVSQTDREALQHLDSFDKILKDSQDYLAKAGTTGAWTPSLRATGKSLMESMDLEQGKLAGLGRYTETESEKYKSKRPDLTGFHFTDADKNKLEELRREVQQKKNAILGGLGMPQKPLGPVVQPRGQAGHQVPLQAGEQVMINKKTGQKIVVKDGKFVRALGE